MLNARRALFSNRVRESEHGRYIFGIILTKMGSFSESLVQGSLSVNLGFCLLSIQDRGLRPIMDFCKLSRHEGPLIHLQKRSLSPHSGNLDFSTDV